MINIIFIIIMNTYFGNISSENITVTNLNVTYINGQPAVINCNSGNTDCPQCYELPPDPSGSQGAQGSQGNTGAQGSTGAIGAQGSTGSIGAQGSTGAIGAQGNTGAIGAQGFTGAIGAQGFTGSIGAQGSTGAIGAQGSTGAQGFTGAQGVTGSSTSGIITNSLILNEGPNIDITDGGPYMLGDNLVNYPISNYSYFSFIQTVLSRNNISGFSGGISGKIIIVINKTGTTQTFINESIYSQPSNRFVLNGNSKIIGINQSVSFIYVTDLTISRLTGQNRWVIYSSS